jgi:hypothetical protein
MSAKPVDLGASAELVDLFQQYAIPPSPLHEALQQAAIEAGWIPPWDREEQRAQKTLAGKRSGLRRGGLAEMRRSLVQVARKRLSRVARNHPYAGSSVDALEEAFQNLLTEGPNGRDVVISAMLEALSDADLRRLKQTGRETLIKDLKALCV